MIKQRKTILIIDNSISFTGAFKCALNQASLLKEDYNFVFLVPKGSTTVEIIKQSNFSYYALPLLEISKSPVKLLLYVPRLLQNTIRLLRIIKKENVSVIQVNDFYNLLGAAVKMLGFKGTLLTYVRFLPTTLPRLLSSVWISLAHKYSDNVIAVSDAVLKQLPSNSKNVKIYDTVLLKELIPPKVIVPDSGSITFLYLGNYIRGKGQDFAIKAFELFIRKQPNALLKFVGGDMGLDKNKAFKAELQQYAIENFLTDKVLFQPFTSDIEVEIKKADIVLNYSEAESFSMTCAEACYFGVPVIATKCGGPEEIICHKETGLLVENKNSEQMVQAMIELASSFKMRKQFSEKSKRYVREKFSSDRFISDFNRILNE